LVDGQRVVMTYNADYIPSPDSAAPWYGRSGFIHPVVTPSGRTVTEGFPADHMHQHGLMFAWTSSSVGPRPVDFWNSRLQAGRVEHLDTVRADSDSIEVRLHHIDATAASPTVVLEETWQINRVPHESMHVFDLVSTQECVTAERFEVHQYHYGAMCVRGPSSWLDSGVTMSTSEGKNQADGNHTRPKWVAMYGSVDDSVCGIVAMSHPSNFRSPQPARLHPKKPYFCFAPMVLGDFPIEPKRPYISRFRFAAFDGEPNVQQFNALWEHYAGQD
jgi:hypothetical protein